MVTEIKDRISRFFKDKQNTVRILTFLLVFLLNVLTVKTSDDLGYSINNGTQYLQDFSYAGYEKGEKALPTTMSGITANVLDYGADSTGGNDSTTAIQNAIKYDKDAENTIGIALDYKAYSKILLRGSPSEEEMILAAELHEWGEKILGTVRQGRAVQSAFN